MTIGFDREEAADVFQVPVQCGLGLGETGPLASGTVLIAKDVEAAYKSVEEVVGKQDEEDWPSVVEKLKSYGFLWEYDNYK